MPGEVGVLGGRWFLGLFLSHRETLENFIVLFVLYLRPGAREPDIQKSVRARHQVFLWERHKLVGGVSSRS